MIRAELLLEALGRAEFGLLAGVPCSYLTSFIDEACSSADTRYVGVVNEGEAIATACGAELGGVRSVALFQNSGLGNAVNPLTSLVAPFRIPILLLTTWRGQPDAAGDEPQHGLMGEITPKLLELMGIAWELLPDDESEIEAALGRAVAHMESESRPYAFIVRKGVVGGASRSQVESSPSEHPSAPLPHAREPAVAIDPDAALRAVQAGVGPADAVLATTGYTGRALYALEDRPSQFYMVGSMGCISSLGLGLAHARPDRRIIVLDGDGAMLMRMGAAATIGYERPPNLMHVLLDNGVHDSTGSQLTVSGTTDLAAVARACGYPRVVRVESAAELEQVVAEPGDELCFVHATTRPRSDRKLPRPAFTPLELVRRFRGWLGQRA